MEKEIKKVLVLGSGALKSDKPENLTTQAHKH